MKTIRISIGPQSTRVRIAADVHRAVLKLKEHLKLASVDEAYRLAVSMGLHSLGVKQ